MPLGVTNDEIADRHGFHPVNDETRPKHEQVRESFIDLAQELNGLLPESREKSLALTALQEAMMWSNASIAIHS